MMPSIEVPIEVSARHLHLCQEHVEALFGEGYELTAKRELSQKGYFVTVERVEVIGEKSSAMFSILTPLRKKTQVEMAITDARKLGVRPVVRMSGNLTGSAPIRLKGPKGELDLSEGAIIAKRHIHMSTALAEAHGLKTGDEVLVAIPGERGATLSHVVISADPTFDLTMHIDTDEGNALNIAPDTFGTVIL
ncbi:MAG: phosphate propanoyltransferase [Turicibacter sp.]|nr:phosphate propanoyltransferase [Turicibacter sp.]